MFPKIIFSGCLNWAKFSPPGIFYWKEILMTQPISWNFQPGRCKAIWSWYFPYYWPASLFEPTCAPLELSSQIVKRRSTLNHKTEARGRDCGRGGVRGWQGAACGQGEETARGFRRRVKDWRAKQEITQIYIVYRVKFNIKNTYLPTSRGLIRLPSVLNSQACSSH